MAAAQVIGVTGHFEDCREGRLFGRDHSADCPRPVSIQFSVRSDNLIPLRIVLFLLGLGSSREKWRFIADAERRVVQILRTSQPLSSMLKITVALPNGHAEVLTLLPSSTVQDLRTRAQQAFGKKYLRLVTAKSRVLANFEQTLEEAEIEDGECLTALVLQPQLAATEAAFALWCHGDSEIITWGDADYGGDSLAVRDQLRGVQQIKATDGAFAAILEDGSVVIWGDADRGGDSSAVRDQLKDVQEIQATLLAFAAILEDGSVVTWGDRDSGGDRSAVRDQLKGVKQIQASPRAFAAILADGSVITWGSEVYGGDSSAVRDQLKGVKQIQATDTAFAAIQEDGSVITWGDARCGGDSSAVRDQLKGVQQSQATGAAAAVREDCGGDTLAVRKKSRLR
eukprot:symbB.v1.2.006862.t1/scaffold415.1/size208980/5